MLKNKEFIRAQIDEAILQEMTSPTQLPDHPDMDSTPSRSSSSASRPPSSAASRPPSSSRPASSSRPPSSQSLPDPCLDHDVSPPKRSRSSTPMEGDLIQRGARDSEQQDLRSPEENLMLRSSMFGASALLAGAKRSLSSPTDAPGFISGGQFVGDPSLDQQSSFYNGIPLIQVPPLIRRHNSSFIQVPPFIQRPSPPFIQISPFLHTSNSSSSLMDDTELTSPPAKRNRKSKITSDLNETEEAKNIEGGISRPINGRPLSLTKLDPLAGSSEESAAISEDMDVPEQEQEEELALVCDWCYSLRPVLVAYKNIGEERKYNFCSQKCFDSFRRVIYKKTKVCGWCGEGGSENESYQVGEEFLHFCSEAHHKLELLRRDGLLQVISRPMEGSRAMPNNFGVQEEPSHSGAKDGREVRRSQPERIAEMSENQEQFNTFVKQLQLYNQQVREKLDMVSPSKTIKHHIGTLPGITAHSTSKEETKPPVNSVINQPEATAYRNFVKVKPDHMLKESTEAKQRVKPGKPSRAINEVKKKEHTPRRKQSLGGPPCQPSGSSAVHKRTVAPSHTGPKFGNPGIPPHPMLQGGLPPGAIPMHGLQNIPPHILMSLGMGLPPPPPPPEQQQKSSSAAPLLSQTTVTHTIPFFVPLPIPIPYPVPIKCERPACVLEEKEKEKKRAEKEKEEQEKRTNEVKTQEEKTKNMMKEAVTKVEQEELKESETERTDDRKLKGHKETDETEIGMSDLDENELIIDEEKKESSPKKPLMCNKEAIIPEEQMAIKLKIYNRKTVINTMPSPSEVDNSSKDMLNKDNIARIRRRAKLFDRSTEKV